jgi:hypothetical protein
MDRRGIGVAMLAMLLGSLANANAQTANTTTRTSTIRDACDPTSFNAVVGPWRFNPMLNATEGNSRLVRLELKPGDKTTIRNVGGETHTFTRVKKFGWGS